MKDKKLNVLLFVASIISIGLNTALLIVMILHYLE